jgi:hypothetical protein
VHSAVSDPTGFPLPPKKTDVSSTAWQNRWQHWDSLEYLVVCSGNKEGRVKGGRGEARGDDERQCFICGICGIATQDAVTENVTGCYHVSLL